MAGPSKTVGVTDHVLTSKATLQTIFVKESVARGAPTMKAIVVGQYFKKLIKNVARKEINLEVEENQVRLMFNESSIRSRTRQKSFQI